MEHVLCLASKKEEKNIKLLERLEKESCAVTWLTSQEFSGKADALRKEFQAVIKEIILYDTQHHCFSDPEALDVKLNEKLLKNKYDKVLIVSDEADIERYHPAEGYFIHLKIKEICYYTDDGRILNLFKIKSYYKRYAHLSLLDFWNKHKGKRAFVVGNGPSINYIDIKKIANEVTFGSNRCFLGFSSWGFAFDYWAICDELQIEKYHSDFMKNLPASIIKFIPYRHAQCFDSENVCGVNYIYRNFNYPQFSSNPNCIYFGSTVTQELLQLAVIMGCNPIYLVGVDHRYDIPKNNVIPDSRHRVEKGVQNHFHSDYGQANQKRLWNLPNLPGIDASFVQAKQYCDGIGVKIYNATPNSALDVFPKVCFNELF